jgi:conjugative transfer region protein (TIGR03748 family)
MPRRFPDLFYSIDRSMRMSRCRGHQIHGLQIGLALIAAAATASATAQLPVAADQLVLGRYTTAVSQPPAELSRPLDVVVALRYPRATVATVGDALQHTLIRSGYRLSQADLTTQAAGFLTLPLPESHRQVGPYRLQAVLALLTGPAWRWHSDDQRRTVWFSTATAAPSPASEPVAQAFRGAAPGAHPHEE